MASTYEPGMEEAAGPEAAEAAPESAEEWASPGGDWETRFLDDLIAANRLKTFLASRGTKLSEELLGGLARLSQAHQRQMDEFIAEERKRKPFLRSFLRSPDDLL